MELCKHCGDEITQFTLEGGEMWMHVDPYVENPRTANGTAWLRCKAKTVATPDR